MCAPIVIGIDPGRAKCGVAAVSLEGVLKRCICPSHMLVECVQELLAEFPSERIVMGGGTNGRRLARAISGRCAFPPVEIVDEEFSTVEAKKRYYTENPVRGWHRLIPGTLRVPREPIDDWAAVILAERWLNSAREG